MSIQIRFTKLPMRLRTEFFEAGQSHWKNTGTSFSEDIGTLLLKQLLGVDLEFHDHGTGYFNDDWVLLKNESDYTFLLLKYGV